MFQSFQDTFGKAGPCRPTRRNNITKNDTIPLVLMVEQMPWIGADLNSGTASRSLQDTDLVCKNSLNLNGKELQIRKPEMDAVAIFQ